MLPEMTSGHGSSPAAHSASITVSLLKGNTLPARNAAMSMPQ